MRKLAAILVLAAAAVPLIGGGAASGQSSPACPPQSTYLPDQAAATAAAAINAAIATSGLGTISADGTVTVSFTSSVCGGFRFVLRAREIRPGNRGYPKHNGITTLANVLTHISAGPTTVTFTLTSRGLALLEYARAHGQGLTVFVIAHVRRDKTSVSAEAIQITTVS